MGDPRNAFGPPRVHRTGFGVHLDPADYSRLSNAMRRAGERAPSVIAGRIIVEWLDAHPDECEPFPEPDAPGQPGRDCESESPFSVGDPIGHDTGPWMVETVTPQQRAEARESVLQLLRSRHEHGEGLGMAPSEAMPSLIRQLESGDAHVWWLASVQLAGAGFIDQETGRRCASREMNGG